MSKKDLLNKAGIGKRNSNFSLPEGPIYKPHFLMFNWLAFDNNGVHCFKNMDYNSIVNVAAKHASTQRHIEFAEKIQKGTWD